MTNMRTKDESCNSYLHPKHGQGRPKYLALMIGPARRHHQIWQLQGTVDRVRQGNGYIIKVNNLQWMFPGDN